MSTTYLARGYPFPIPVLSVRFRRIAETTASIPHKAIIDTGADMTIAPADVLIALQAQELSATRCFSSR